MFSSPNQLDFKSTSRRDDLISLFYMLVYILHEGDNIPAFTVNKFANRFKEMQRIKTVKLSLKPKDLCFGTSSDLNEFMIEVFSYQFKDKPNYHYLRDLLRKAKTTNEHYHEISDDTTI